MAQMWIKHIDLILGFHVEEKNWAWAQLSKETYIHSYEFLLINRITRILLSPLNRIWQTYNFSESLTTRIFGLVNEPLTDLRKCAKKRIVG